jgi:dihydrofolate reductase
VTRLHLIFARARNGVIGKDNAMPWRLPEDLAHFKAKTMGAPVIMGRRTWDSIPPKFRPLPGRRNIVVTRQGDWQAGGAERAGSLEEAIALCGSAPDAWVTGGAGLFTDALPFASTVEVTEIEIDVEGDTFAPALDASWHEVARERYVSANGLGYSFVTYKKDRDV